MIYSYEKFKSGTLFTNFYRWLKSREINISRYGEILLNVICRFTTLYRLPIVHPIIIVCFRIKNFAIFNINEVANTVENIFNDLFFFFPFFFFKSRDYPFDIEIKGIKQKFTYQCWIICIFFIINILERRFSSQNIVLCLFWKKNKYTQLNDGTSFKKKKLISNSIYIIVFI